VSSDFRIDAVTLEQRLLFLVAETRSTMCGDVFLR